eukprot:tig00000786_g4058.t1
MAPASTRRSRSLAMAPAAPGAGHGADPGAPGAGDAAAASTAQHAAALRLASEGLRSNRYEEILFSVLSTMVDRSGPSAASRGLLQKQVVPVVLCFIDAFQLAALADRQAWSPSTISWITQGPDVYALVTDTIFGQSFAAIFWTVVALIMIAFGLCGFLWVSLRHQHFFPLPAKILRLLVNLLVGAFYITVLNILASAFTLGLDPDDPGFTPRPSAITSMPWILYAAVGAVQIAAFVPAACILSLLFVDFCPLSKNVEASPHGRLRLVYTLCQTGLVFLVRFLHSSPRTVNGVLALVCAFNSLLMVWFQPYYSRAMNAIRAGLFASAAFFALASMCLIQQDAPASAAAPAAVHASTDSVLSVVLLAATVLSGVLVAALCALRHWALMRRAWRRAHLSDAEAAAEQGRSFMEKWLGVTGGFAIEALIEVETRFVWAPEPSPSVAKASKPEIGTGNATSESGPDQSAVPIGSGPAEKYTIRPTPAPLRSPTGSVANASGVNDHDDGSVAAFEHEQDPEADVDLEAGRGGGGGAAARGAPEDAASAEREKERQRREAVADTLYRRGLEKHSGSCYIRVCYSAYLQYHIGDPVAAINEMKQAMYKKPPLDMRFLMSSKRMEFESRNHAANLSGDAANRSSFVDVLEFRNLYDRATADQNHALQLIKGFWASLVRRMKRGSIASEGLGELTNVLQEIEKAKRAADDAYGQLHKKYPTSKVLLRAYGVYLQTIGSDPERGLELLQKADELEDHDSRAHAGMRTARTNEDSQSASGSQRSGSSRSSRRKRAQHHAADQVHSREERAVSRLAVGVIIGLLAIGALAVAFYLQVSNFFQTLSASIFRSMKMAIGHRTFMTNMYWVRLTQMYAFENNRKEFDRVKNNVVVRAKMQDDAFSALYMNGFPKEGIRPSTNAGVLRAWEQTNVDVIEYIPDDTNPNAGAKRLVGMRVWDAAHRWIYESKQLARYTKEDLQGDKFKNIVGLRFLFDNVAIESGGINSALEDLGIAYENEIRETTHSAQGSLIGLVIASLSLLFIIGFFVLRPSINRVRSTKHGISDLIANIPSAVIKRIHKHYKAMKFVNQDEDSQSEGEGDDQPGDIPEDEEDAASDKAAGENSDREEGEGDGAEDRAALHAHVASKLRFDRMQEPVAAASAKVHPAPPSRAGSIVPASVQGNGPRPSSKPSSRPVSSSKRKEHAGSGGVASRSASVRNSKVLAAAAPAKETPTLDHMRPSSDSFGASRRQSWADERPKAVSALARVRAEVAQESPQPQPQSDYAPIHALGPQSRASPTPSDGVGAIGSFAGAKESNDVDGTTFVLQAAARAVHEDPVFEFAIDLSTTAGAAEPEPEIRRPRSFSDSEEGAAEHGPNLAKVEAAADAAPVRMPAAAGGTALDGLVLSGELAELLRGVSDERRDTVAGVGCAASGANAAPPGLPLLMTASLARRPLLASSFSTAAAPEPEIKQQPRKNSVLKRTAAPPVDVVPLSEAGTSPPLSAATMGQSQPPAANVSPAGWLEGLKRRLRKAGKDSAEQAPAPASHDIFSKARLAAVAIVNGNWSQFPYSAIQMTTRYIIAFLVLAAVCVANFIACYILLQQLLVIPAEVRLSGLVRTLIRELHMWAFELTVNDAQILPTKQMMATRLEAAVERTETYFRALKYGNASLGIPFDRPRYAPQDAVMYGGQKCLRTDPAACVPTRVYHLDEVEQGLDWVFTVFLKETATAARSAGVLDAAGRYRKDLSPAENAVTPQWNVTDVFRRIRSLDNMNGICFDIDNGFEFSTLLYNQDAQERIASILAAEAGVLSFILIFLAALYRYLPALGLPSDPLRPSAPATAAAAAAAAAAALRSPPRRACAVLLFRSMLARLRDECGRTAQFIKMIPKEFAVQVASLRAEMGERLDEENDDDDDDKLKRADRDRDAKHKG